MKLASSHHHLTSCISAFCRLIKEHQIKSLINTNTEHTTDYLLTYPKNFVLTQLHGSRIGEADHPNSSERRIFLIYRLQTFSNVPFQLYISSL